MIRWSARAALSGIGISSAILSFGAFTPAAQAGSGWPCDANANSQFEALVNQARQQNGLNTLPNDTAAQNYACYWSDQQEKNKTVEHSNETFGLEIAGADTSVQGVFNKFMADSAHRADILDPHDTRQGAGLVWDGNWGVYWTTEEFPNQGAAIPSPPPYSSPASPSPSSSARRSASPSPSPRPSVTQPATSPTSDAPSSASVALVHGASPNSPATASVTATPTRAARDVPTASKATGATALPSSPSALAQLGVPSHSASAHSGPLAGWRLAVLVALGTAAGAALVTVFVRHRRGAARR